MPKLANWLELDEKPLVEETWRKWSEWTRGSKMANKGKLIPNIFLWRASKQTNKHSQILSVSWVFWHQDWPCTLTPRCRMAWRSTTWRLRWGPAWSRHRSNKAEKVIARVCWVVHCGRMLRVIVCVCWESDCACVSFYSQSGVFWLGCFMYYCFQYIDGTLNLINIFCILLMYFAI